MRRDVAPDGALLDRFTQRWVIATGRPVELEGADRWLDGPIGSPEGIGEDWIDQYADRRGARLQEGDPQGLLPEFGALSGAGFAVGAVSPTIVDFSETTSDWSMDVWSRWSRWAARRHGRRRARPELPRRRVRDDGAYLVVRPDARPQGWARRVPLPERFELFTDADRVLRCDHRLGLGGHTMLRLHYRLQRAPGR